MLPAASRPHVTPRSTCRARDSPIFQLVARRCSRAQQITRDTVRTLCESFEHLTRQHTRASTNKVSRSTKRVSILCFDKVKMKALKRSCPNAHGQTTLKRILEKKNSQADTTPEKAFDVGATKKKLIKPTPALRGRKWRSRIFRDIASENGAGSPREPRKALVY